MNGNPNSASERPLDEVRAEANRYQFGAADPESSAWVSANAGTGKTYVLVLRVLRLLLSGASADSILCLTFTKAAAAEMSNRLIARLGEWAAMSDEALYTELCRLLNRAPSSDESETARCLFAKVLDAPGGLKIMTIHAFCDRVLRRFPLEAGVPPSFTILTDEERTAAVRTAIEQVLQNASQEPESTLGKALTRVIASAGETRFQELIETMIGKREDLMRLIRAQMTDDPFEGIEVELRSALGAAPDDDEEALLDEQATLISDNDIARMVPALREGKKTDQALADALARARGKSGQQRCEMFAEAFLTKSGEARSDRFMTKDIREGQPGLAAQLDQARDDFAALGLRLRAVAVTSASCALMRLADAILQYYEDAKLQRSAIDFDGLIARTAALFTRSDASAWVLFRLDAALSHILVDEAQDTSPAQWELIRGLTSEFYAGEGTEDRQNTLFAVGDEKQSIYRFQGADPRQFIETGRDYSQRARQARQPWVEAPLTLSFRSTRAVLDAVDLVFAERDKTPGLTAEPKLIKHFANREGAGGRVEIWEPIKPEKRDDALIWEPFSDAASAAPPANQLAARIAGQIRHWLDDGEILASQNRPIRPSDILILVRKRAPFAAPMVKALKSCGIPVAGADRMRLTEQLAVMDLMALGDALLLPQDDLTLAALLKSPIFGFSEDELFALAYQRTGSLWSALEEKGHTQERFCEAHARLVLWQSQAVAVKPFDFYTARLDSDGLRARLLAGLGPDAADPISELLNLALAYETSETPTLQGFLQWLRSANPEIKRDMDAGREEVRVMTVHGSKGLEANVVFLADSYSIQSASRNPVIQIAPSPPAPPNAPRLPVWTLPGSQLIPAIGASKEAEASAEGDEYQRLLYVAMTRARDRLYIAGFEGQRPRSAACWYNLISGGLEGCLSEEKDFAGNRVQRMDFAQTAPPDGSAQQLQPQDATPIPEWPRLKPEDMSRPIVFNPSRLDLPSADMGTDSLHSATQNARPRGEALLRGRAAHRLLELLPSFDEDGWMRAGSAFLNAEAKGLTAAEREDLLHEITAILKNPDYGPLFGPDSRAEVGFTVEYTLPDDDNMPVLISGQIDRLVIQGDQILILDFKTGGAIPQSPEDAPDAYLAQLAAYALAMKQLEPEKAIQTMILWTEGPCLMPFPDTLMARGGEHLYEAIRRVHLDQQAIHT